MAQVTIAWTRLAVADLNQAYDYIVASNPDAAAGIVERIEKAVRADVAIERVKSSIGCH